MHQTATEISAYVAFWSVMNDQVNDLTDEVQLFARQLQATEEKPRYERCTKYIHDSNTNGMPSLPRIYTRCWDLLGLSLNGNSGLD